MKTLLLLCTISTELIKSVALNVGKNNNKKNHSSQYSGLQNLQKKTPKPNILYYMYCSIM